MTNPIRDILSTSWEQKNCKRSQNNSFGWLSLWRYLFQRLRWGKIIIPRSSPSFYPKIPSPAGFVINWKLSRNKNSAYKYAKVSNFGYGLWVEANDIFSSTTVISEWQLHEDFLQLLLGNRVTGESLQRLLLGLRCRQSCLVCMFFFLVGDLDFGLKIFSKNCYNDEGVSWRLSEM